MGIIRLSFVLTRACFGRILLFACLTALLCATAVLLGSFLLSGEGAIEPITIAIADEDNSIESRMLTSYLQGIDQDHRLLNLMQSGTPEAENMLAAGQASAVIVIPEGFIAGIMDGSNPPFAVMLNAGAPMRSGIIRLFAGVYADMLRTGQQGVYIALDAASEHGRTEQWQEMFRVANLRFLTAMLNRESVQETRTLNPAGETGVALHYGAAAFVFLMLLGSSLFLDIWARVSSRPVLLRLGAMGAGKLKIGLCCLAGAVAPFGTACLLLVLGVAAANHIFGLGLAVSTELLPALIMLVLCGAAFLTAVSRLFGQGPGGSVFVFLYGLAGLFLSGGILPPAYLAPALTALGRLTPHYWLGRMLSHGLVGQIDLDALFGSLAFIVFFALISLWSILRDGKVGEKT